MAHPTSFMFQHNNISQLNSNYFTTNISKKYKGYRFKFSHIISQLIKFCLKKKSKIKLKILYRKIFLKKRKINYLIKFKKYKIKRFWLKWQDICYYDLLENNNSWSWRKTLRKKLFLPQQRYYFRRKWRKKIVKKILRRSTKKFKIKLKWKKKKIRKFLRFKYKFNVIIFRFIKVKNISFLFFISKRIAKKKFIKIKVFKKIKFKKFLNKLKNKI